MILSALFVAALWLSPEPVVSVVILCIVFARTFLFRIYNVYSAIAFCAVPSGMTFLIWFLLERNIELAWTMSLKSFVTLVIFVHFIPSTDSILNFFTIRIPVLRDVLLITSRSFDVIRGIVEDVRYSSSIERKKSPFLASPGIFIQMLVIIINEVILLVERMTTVIVARGRFPPVQLWYSAESIPISMLVYDVGCILGIFVFVTML